MKGADFMKKWEKRIKANLLMVLEQLEGQGELARLFPPNISGFDETIGYLRHLILNASEYDLACSHIFTLFEDYPFKLSGKAVTALVDCALLMGFKANENASD
jgi:hypothetical protein